nr:hypothetical protein [Paracoccus sp. (in: a-proteobacteria)]
MGYVTLTPAFSRPRVNPPAPQNKSTPAIRAFPVSDLRSFACIAALLLSQFVFIGAKLDFRRVLLDISADEFSDDLCRGFVIRGASLKKALAQLSLHPDAKSSIFHRPEV